MTRKDFVLIAETISGLPVDAATKSAIALRFVEVLDNRNPFFDGARFLGAATAAEA